MCADINHALPRQENTVEKLVISQSIARRLIIMIGGLVLTILCLFMATNPGSDDEKYKHLVLGPVDKVPDPESDSGDVYEAEIAVSGLVVSRRQAA